MNRLGLLLFVFTSVAAARHDIAVGSPYCSDPNCAYCKELREAEEKLKAQQGSANRGAA